MNWYFIVLIIVSIIILLIGATFRIKYGTFSMEKIKEKKSNISVDNAEEVKRRETFRQMIKNFVQKY